MKVRLYRLLRNTGLAVGASDTRRVVAQGGVRINGAAVADGVATVDVAEGDVVEVGRKRRVLTRGDVGAILILGEGY